MQNFFMGIVVPLSVLLPIGMFLRKRKHADRPARIIFYYLLSAGLINACAVFLAKIGLRNLPLLHVYTLVETLFFLSYFYVIFDSNIVKKAIKVLMFVFPLLCVINFTFIQSIFTYNTHTRPLEALIVTSLCLTYFYKSGFVDDWLSISVNWINMGMLVYFPAASIIFILSNYFTFVDLDSAMTDIVWNMHAFLVLGMYLIFTKAFSLINKNDG